MITKKFEASIFVEDFLAENDMILNVPDGPQKGIENKTSSQNTSQGEISMELELKSIT